jgi:PadR family transcriptional regulator PadR
MPPKDDLLPGTLDVLVLQILAGGPSHGWGIAQKMKLLSREVLQVQQGSLYPALHKLVVCFKQSVCYSVRSVPA